MTFTEMDSTPFPESVDAPETEDSSELSEVSSDESMMDTPEDDQEHSTQSNNGTEMQEKQAMDVASSGSPDEESESEETSEDEQTLDIGLSEDLDKETESEEESEEEESRLWGESASFGSELVHVLVGHEKRKFSLHKRLICSSSLYFERAFNGPFIEGITSTIKLKHVRPAIFSAYVEWLYTQAEPVVEIYNNLDKLISLYIFADKIQSYGLKDYTMDEIQDNMKHHSKTFTLEQLKRIFALITSSRTSPIRRYAAAMISHNILCKLVHPSFFQEVFKKVPELCEEFVRFQREMSIFELKLKEDPRCRHMHDDRGNYRLCDFHAHEVLKDSESCKSHPNCMEYCTHNHEDSDGLDSGYED